MRIAIFSEVYWPMVSGVGVTLVRLVDALTARGHQVRVYSASYALPPDQPERPEVHRSPGIPLFLYPDVLWALPRQRAITDDLRQFRPDVVHLATEFAMGLAGLKAARHLGLPIVASAHTDYQKYAHRYRVEWATQMGWMYLRWFYGHARRVLVPTRIYERVLQGRGVRRTGLWTRGVDPGAFSPAFRSETWRSRFGVGPEDLLVTYIGRLAREKELDRLLDAWTSLPSRPRNAQLVLVGHGPLANEVRGRALPGVHLAGLLGGAELGAAYASADLFVFPSTTETFGNSLLEAMASGLACLTVRAGGIPEFAQDGVNALVVDPHDTGALAAGLTRLMADAALRRGLAEGGLATARARDWGRIHDGLIEEYRAAAGAARAEHAA